MSTGPGAASHTARGSVRRLLELPLETPRLTLREFAQADLPAMLAYGSDRRVSRYLLFAPENDDIARRHLAAVLRQQRSVARNSWELAVVDGATGTVVGACELTLTSRDEGDIGYVLAHAHWGHGYATEIVLALVEAGFGQLGLERVVATIDVRNKRSMRVVEKAGLRWEGTLRRHAEARGRRWDVELYALSREEWQAARA